MGAHNDRHRNGPWRRSTYRRFFLRRPVCEVCGHEVRAGRAHEHADCLEEIDRRADAAIPNPRRRA